MDVNDYINSLNIISEKINKNIDKKALKDRVGTHYENHRKNIWQKCGGICDKDKKFGLDLVIYDRNGLLIAIEEVKGHYLDSCFLSRFLVSIGKLINTYIKNNIIEKCPVIILHSFTRYNLYENSLEDMLDIFDEKIVSVIKNKLIYSYLCDNDRIKKNKWFSSLNGKNINPYSLASKILINKDLKIINDICKS